MKKLAYLIPIATAIAAFAWAGKPSAAPRPQYSFAPPAGWRPETLNGVDAAWVAGDTSGSTIAVNTSSSSPIDPSDIDIEKVVSALEKARGYIYSFFGMSDWAVDWHRLDPVAGGLKLELVGHYRGAGGRKTRFLERDFFLGSRFYQIVFSQDADSRGAKPEAEIRKLLDRFEARE